MFKYGLSYTQAQIVNFGHRWWLAEEEKFYQLQTKVVFVEYSQGKQNQKESKSSSSNCDLCKYMFANGSLSLPHV